MGVHQHITPSAFDNGNRFALVYRRHNAPSPLKPHGSLIDYRQPVQPSGDPLGIDAQDALASFEAHCVQDLGPIEPLHPGNVNLFQFEPLPMDDLIIEL